MSDDPQPAEVQELRALVAAQEARILDLESLGKKAAALRNILLLAGLVSSAGVAAVAFVVGQIGAWNEVRRFVLNEEGDVEPQLSALLAPEGPASSADLIALTSRLERTETLLGLETVETGGETVISLAVLDGFSDRLDAIESNFLRDGDRVRMWTGVNDDRAPYYIGLAGNPMWDTDPPFRGVSIAPNDNERSWAVERVSE